MPDWWQTLPFRISPYLFQVNGFGIRYYSLMYLAAFLSVYLLVRYRLRQESHPYSLAIVQDFLVWSALGVVIGGRLGYVLFYNLPYYMEHPLEIFLPVRFSGGFRFTGITGMSFHGGLIGVALVVILFCRKQCINLWQFSDLFVPAVPLGYFFGRLGNFLNGELYGTPTLLPWAMIFPSDPAQVPRHPSQLYEAFFEGLVLFAWLWAVRNHPRFSRRLFALYLMGYGTVRFFIEFVRQPDAHLGSVALGLSMGQLLCAAMAAAGAVVFAAQNRSRSSAPGPPGS